MTGSRRSARGSVAQGAEKTKRLVLVLDEFQWLCEAAPELPSLLQHLWIKSGSVDPGFMLILCGSYLGVHGASDPGSKSPLFGRRTGQILLEPFDYRKPPDSFRTGRSSSRLAPIRLRRHSLHLKTFDAGGLWPKTWPPVFSPWKLLYFAEPDFLLREELRDVGTYSSVIEAIAEGKNSPTQIAALTGCRQSIALFP